MSEKKSSDSVESARHQYEHVYRTLRDSKANKSNEYPVGDHRRKEHDLDEIEKAYLNFHQTNVLSEVLLEFRKTVQNSADSSTELSRKIHSLNIIGIFLTIIIALSAGLEAIITFYEWWNS